MTARRLGVGLMVVLFALGMMSIGWMVVVAVAIAVEKIAPHGDRLGTPIALALVGAGTRLTLA
jgi:predicted metal-binding membrane protein